MAKRFYRMCKILSPFCCKKLSQNGAPNEKFIPVLPKVNQVMVLRGTNWQKGRRRLGQSLPILQCRTTAEQSFSASEQPRAKRPWCMHLGYHQMKSRRAAMQGCKHKAACNLSRAYAARVYTRRIARASQVA